MRNFLLFTLTLFIFGQAAFALDEISNAKKWQLSVGMENFGTFHSLFLTGFIFSAGYNVDQEWQIFGTYSPGFHYIFDENHATSIKVKGLGVRKLVTNTFYLKASLSQQDVETSKTTDWTIKGSVNTLDIFVGSLWASGSSFIALDWFGFSSPPLSSSIREDMLSPNAGDIERTKYHQTKDVLIHDGRFRGPTIYWGYQF